jgi:uncharacterized surface protein with fasciclin (FAS1) repeats
MTCSADCCRFPGAYASWAFGNDVNQASCTTVTQTLSDGKYSYLTAALEKNNLTDYFNQTDLMVTMFAPTDEAFKFTADKRNTTVEKVTGKTEADLKTLLEAHVVPGLVWLDTFTVNSMDGNTRLTIKPTVMVEGSWSKGKSASRTQHTTHHTPHHPSMPTPTPQCLWTCTLTRWHACKHK